MFVEIRKPKEEVQGGQGEDDIVTILPVEINFKFWAAYTKGYSTRFGNTQELYFDWVSEFFSENH